MSEFKGTTGLWFSWRDCVEAENGNTIVRVQGCFDADTEAANTKLIALAGNLAQKHSPETWEVKLYLFDRMTQALDSAVNDYTALIELVGEEYQSDLDNISELLEVIAGIKSEEQQ